MASDSVASEGGGPDVEERLADVRRRFDDMEEYDARIQMFVPGYEEMLEAVAFLLDRQRPVPGSVLDLGTGTGAVAARIAETLPDAQVTAVDFSPEMLDRARARLEGHLERIDLVEGDLRDVEIPQGTEAVVSCLAVHHLEDEDKQALFERIARALDPGALFVLGDAVAMPGPVTNQRIEDWWRAFLDGSCEGTGFDPEAVLAQARHEDRPSTTHDQVDWLAAAGFGEATTVWQRFNVAVIAAIR